MKYIPTYLNQIKWISLVSILLRISFGLLFVFSSLIKFIDLESFSNSIKDFHILGELLIPVISYSVPSLELFFGIMIILNIKRMV